MQFVCVHAHVHVSVCVCKCIVEHKRMLNLGFEGLYVAFEALTNVFTPH